MALYMLDTDISSYLIRGAQPALIAAFRKHVASCCISSMTAAELLFGAKKRNSKILTQNVKAYCDLLPIRDWTMEAAKAYARIRLETEAKGTPLGAMDMLIAASAIAEGAVLVTNNIAHFSKVSELKIENWADG
ncbi:MAG: type II toxin-antitoxin system VapC family toxin [Lentisphaerae bacterium]|nr:type II toxin-antitoxin system VapC family toxin [Lentisphaerota bacterium]